MELLIPMIAMGGVYFATTRKSVDDDRARENFAARDALPNTDIIDKNYATADAIVADTDRTSKLATVNTFDSPSVYTDKYFAPAAPPAGAAEYRSLAGDTVDATYFSHNNMVPFFGSKSHRPADHSAGEAVMDAYVGAGSMSISRREQAPMFDASDSVNWTNGMPSATDFIQSRMNPVQRQANVNPFREPNVGPGLGPDAASGGSGGFNAGTMARELWTEKTVDDLRTTSKPKASGFGLLGYEGAAVSSIKRTGTIGIMEKNRVDASFEMGRDRLFTTVGVEKAQPNRAQHIPRDVARPDTDTDYIGNAGTRIAAEYVPGEYMASTNISLDAAPLAPAYARGTNSASTNDYGADSVRTYPNSRTANYVKSADGDGYFGAISGALGNVLAPIFSELRPSRRENTIGTLRPFPNAKASVNNTYVFNPRDALPRTIRETTDQTRQSAHINAGQRGGAYNTTSVKLPPNQRDSTTDVYYAGGAGATEGARAHRSYGAEYAQRNNESKPAMLSGYTPSGGMATLNHVVNMASRERDTRQFNDRPMALAHGGAASIPSMATLGRVEGAGNTLYAGTQSDRNDGSILKQLKGNPFVHGAMR